MMVCICRGVDSVSSDRSASRDKFPLDPLPRRLSPLAPLYIGSRDEMARRVIARAEVRDFASYSRFNSRIKLDEWMPSGELCN